MVKSLAKRGEGWNSKNYGIVELGYTVYLIFAGYYPASFYAEKGLYYYEDPAALPERRGQVWMTQIPSWPAYNNTTSKL
jgi:hypothetical protein